MSPKTELISNDFNKINCENIDKSNKYKRLDQK